MGYEGDYCDPRFHATYFRRGRRLYLLDKSDGGSKIELTIDTSILERRIPFDFVPPPSPPCSSRASGREETIKVGREKGGRRDTLDGRLKEREEGKKKSMSGNVRRWRRGGGGGGSDGAVVSLFPSLTLVQQRRNF